MIGVRLHFLKMLSVLIKHTVEIILVILFLMAL